MTDENGILLARHRETGDPLTAAQNGDDLSNQYHAGCNSCRNLIRLPFDRNKRNPLSIYGIPGVCAKDGRNVLAFEPHIFMGSSCWESRRSDRVSEHVRNHGLDHQQYAHGPHYGLTPEPPRKKAT